ncbi:exopolysaccharide biosynthesis protein [Pseudoxanthomonas broegbernensis]|uniref:non-specific protein-tyrosine kinase n=1 Tax=Pseudoxanthomonas broegbernensis TaxID=83619 RepID=A0A7V8K7Z2_9GAMM|nr:polysaccharide biosynthesis tyrosine autokinase [Pseudoxanthomonas broegbernensis]KAF1687190.1 exopolysaccharide biosynthesis protein [Pseudoxanthomonas broegbernensis]MBB6065829.1 capsular exopolysaccharide synthesis family protein [Pseudoxanthomonas broegbernensis]
MSKDNLPTGPMDDGESRLPAPALPTPRVPAALAAPERNALLLDVAREERDDDTIDLLAYWRIIVKRRWLILGILGGVVAVALVATLMATPIYRATAVLQIERQSQQVVQSGELGIPTGVDPEFLTTQIGLLKSRTLAERVVDDLDLDKARLERLNPPSWSARLKAVVRPQENPAAGAGPAGDGDSEAERRAAADMVQQALTIAPQPRSRLVSIHFDSPDRNFSARAANAIADGYIAGELERRFGASSYAKTYLEQQLLLSKSRLEDAERKLVEFAQKENLVSDADGRSLVGQNLSDLNASLAQAQAQRIRAQARWTQVQSSGALPQDMLSGSIAGALRQQRADVQRTYQEKGRVFKPEYPEMQQLRSQIEEIDRQIAAEIAGVRRSVKAEYDAAVRQEALLQTQLAQLRDQTLDTDSRSIQYNILKREADTSRQLYDGLLQRYKEVGVAGDVRPNNISVIDRAQAPPWRYKPNVLLNLALGVLLGVVIGVLVALALEFLDDTIKTPDDVEHRLGLSVLGIIPQLSKQTVATAAADLRSAFSESYRSVRTALQFSTDQGVPKALLITSSGPGEGKSTSAMTLARNFAQLGKRTLLIEADMRNPSLHRLLELGSGKGLSNLLSGAGKLEDAVLPTRQARLDVILAGPLPPNPAELLSGSRLVSLLSIAGNVYDQIVIDGPPVLGLADAAILGNVADATLFVVQSGSTKIGNAQAVIKRLLGVRARIIGVLLTKYNARTAGYGYQYESYYAYGARPQLTKR